MFRVEHFPSTAYFCPHFLWGEPKFIDFRIEKNDSILNERKKGRQNFLREKREKLNKLLWNLAIQREYIKY